MIRGRWLLMGLAMLVAACSDSSSAALPTTDLAAAGDGLATPGVNGGPVGGGADVEAVDGVTTTTAAAGTTTANTRALVDVSGTVRSAVDGAPLEAVRITAGSATALTGADGVFDLRAVVGETLTVERPVWRTIEQPVTTGSAPLALDMEPVVVRGLRVAKAVAGDRARFDELLALIEGTTVNTLVFDTKDETNVVLYDTEVALANEMGAVEAVYDPGQLLALARDRNLYAVTRIVTFEDGGWAAARPQAKLAGSWVNAADEANWAYPLALAEEACALGFDEIQFDYVRFPAGRTAEVAAALLPATGEERAAIIARFLTEARNRLHPMGCGVSAAIFGIVMSSETDEGIGQTPETVSSAVDAVSPMLYPSHYGRGWLGFTDPNDHPGPVIAHALDTGAAKVQPNVLVRPWIQGFDYNGQQVLAQINESEARGAGWIIWNYPGNYRRDWLPSA